MAGHRWSKVENTDLTKLSNLRLRKDIFEARRVRDAVKTKPDILEKTTDELIAQGLV